MARNAPAITVDELKTLLIAKAIQSNYEDEYDVIDRHNPDIERIIYSIVEDLPKVIKDWKKVNFDLENIIYEGTKVTNSGIPYFQLEAGGDWETPVVCIIYHDGKDFRGFVPKNGNIYNYKTKTAFGNADDWDDDVKQFEHQFAMKVYNDEINLDPIWTQIYAEIENRLNVKQSTPKIINDAQDIIDGKVSNVTTKQKQIAKETTFPKTGPITKDDVYFVVNAAADGAYITFVVKESGRSLTIEEGERVEGVPNGLTYNNDYGSGVWYTKNGVYSKSAVRIMEANGFTLEPNSYVAPDARVIYI